MGHDVWAIGKHNLKTENIEDLANVLSKRFGANVEFGYYPDQKYAKILTPEMKVEDITHFEKLGEININSNLKTIFLTDNTYEERKLYKQFGEKKFIEIDEIEEDEKSELDNIIGNYTEINYDFESYVDGKSELWIVINKGIFTDWNSFCFSWMWLIRYIENTYIETDQLKFFHERRKIARQNALNLGTDYLYYISDQSEIGLEINYEISSDWNAFENYLKQNANNEIINVPKLFLDKDYREFFNNLEDYPDVFYDDFKDLE